MDTKKITTSEPNNDVKREKVRVIPIQFFDDVPKHPFNVKMDEEMEALIESIKEFGILTPLIARKKENERYEIIAGEETTRTYRLAIIFFAFWYSGNLVTRHL